MPPMPKAELLPLAVAIQPIVVHVGTNDSGCIICSNTVTGQVVTNCPTPPIHVCTLAWLYDTNAPKPWTNVWALQTSTDLKQWETLFCLTSWQTLYQFTNNEPERFFRMAKVGAIGK